jgi:hypothetical protein
MRTIPLVHSFWGTGANPSSTRPALASVSPLPAHAGLHSTLLTQVFPGPSCLQFSSFQYLKLLRSSEYQLFPRKLYFFLSFSFISGESVRLLLCSPSKFWIPNPCPEWWSALQCNHTEPDAPRTSEWSHFSSSDTQETLPLFTSMNTNYTVIFHDHHRP